ncbi:MAG: hypothetical protein JWR84_3026 [Caulobacter sp.]|nr:hypothetical protein [Caulobacter sp.]
MTDNDRDRVAIVWRGDNEMRNNATPENNRLKGIFAALTAAGLKPEPAVFDEAFQGEFEDQLLGVAAVLVWVDPVHRGVRRAALDQVLRRVAGKGVLVSGRPDIIDRMGVKSVLHETRALGWGSASAFYETPEVFRRQMPGSLATGPRVLKQNRGNGGHGVWRVEPIEGDAVHVRSARPETAEQTLPLALFLTQWSDELSAGDGLVDQPFFPRLMDGMVRCYMSGDRVAGFGHQLVTALADPSAGPPQPRLYSGPDDERFQDLRRLMETDWAPGLCRQLTIGRHELPVIWDADFLFGEPTPGNDRGYVLCEINANSVFPIPDEAPAALAATLRARLI